MVTSQAVSPRFFSTLINLVHHPIVIILYLNSVSIYTVILEGLGPHLKRSLHHSQYPACLCLVPGNVADGVGHIGQAKKNLPSIITYLKVDIDKIVLLFFWKPH